VEERIIPLKLWADGSDRDLTVAGRHSRRFYRHATRWMVNEVSLHQGRQADVSSQMRLLKSLVNAKLGRLGMLLTQHEVETGD
jgi:hypothetical protein